MLLLFVAALVGGSVDAIACQPEFEAASVVGTHAADSDDHAPKGQRDHGDTCVHGHCHAGWQLVPRENELIAPAVSLGTYGFHAATSRGYLIASTPEHPPRI